ncbi:MAG: hypothetical protein WCF99_02985 [Chloroflexales bacterium]
MTTQTSAPRAHGSLRISGLAYAALILVLFFGTIQVAQYAGLWSASDKLMPDGSVVQLSGADPAEIKGWMTIESVVNAYHVKQAALYARFTIPSETPPSTALKDLEAVAPDFSVPALREWLTEQSAP